jgi:hypothetical protein
MIRISINSVAFEAIAATLPFGSAGFEQEPDAKGLAMRSVILVPLSAALPGCVSDVAFPVTLTRSVRPTQDLPDAVRIAD